MCPGPLSVIERVAPILPPLTPMRPPSVRLSPLLLTVPDTARRLRRHEQTIRAMIRRGDLAAIRLGRLVRVLAAAVDRAGSCGAQDAAHHERRDVRPGGFPREPGPSAGAPADVARRGARLGEPPLARARHELAVAERDEAAERGRADGPDRSGPPPPLRDGAGRPRRSGRPGTSRASGRCARPARHPRAGAPGADGEPPRAGDDGRPAARPDADRRGSRWRSSSSGRPQAPRDGPPHRAPADDSPAHDRRARGPRPAPARRAAPCPGPCTRRPRRAWPGSGASWPSSTAADPPPGARASAGSVDPLRPGPPTPCSRSTNFWTLPVEVFGRSPNSTAAGHLKWAMCSRQNSMISASVACAPGLRVTNAFGRSPHFSSGIGHHRALQHGRVLGHAPAPPRWSRCSRRPR